MSIENFKKVNDFFVHNYVYVTATSEYHLSGVMRPRVTTEVNVGANTVRPRSTWAHW